VRSLRAPEQGRVASADWVIAERAASTSLAEASAAGSTHEGDLARTVVAALPNDANLVISSSMPIRDVDAFSLPRDGTLHVFANRGASGIDGVVSTAYGIASQREGPTICLIGDVAFFHDQNGLLWHREPDAAVVFVLIDNDGGGIFQMLPIAGHDPAFTRYFSTPHGIDPSHAAAAHGIDYHDVTTDAAGDQPNALTEAVARAVVRGESTVLRVRTDRGESHSRRAAVLTQVARSVREALG
jgi:2-succinyl-5-enolpyruvyl-6-hydroxy-3-cyclohexene-1-carboxylate synthase